MAGATGSDACREEISEEADLDRGDRSFQVRKKLFSVGSGNLFSV